MCQPLKNMRFIKKYLDTNFILKVNVKTNSKKQKIVNDGDSLTIFLKSKPVQNKANKELIDLIKRRLIISSNQIQIIHGLKSHDKLIKLNFLEINEEQDIIRKLID